MSLSREEMIKKMKCSFGENNKWVIWFCEKANNKKLSEEEVVSALTTAMRKIKSEL